MSMIPVLTRVTGGHGSAPYHVRQTVALHRPHTNEQIHSDVAVSGAGCRTDVAALGGGLDSDGVHHLLHGHQLAALAIEEAGQAADGLLHVALLVGLHIDVPLQYSTDHPDCLTRAIMYACDNHSFLEGHR